MFRKTDTTHQLSLQSNIYINILQINHQFNLQVKQHGKMFFTISL